MDGVAERFLIRARELGESEVERCVFRYMPHHHPLLEGIFRSFSSVGRWNRRDSDRYVDGARRDRGLALRVFVYRDNAAFQRVPSSWVASIKGMGNGCICGHHGIILLRASEIERGRLKFKSRVCEVY